MANPDHLALLTQKPQAGGIEEVQTWNTWRDEHPEIRPDLSGAFLNSGFFHGINFVDADLRGADLTNASLFRASLSRADLTGATIQCARLAETYCKQTIFDEADLSGASFVKGEMSGATFRMAKMVNARLVSAYLGSVDLTGADLTGADISQAVMIHTNLAMATLAYCRVYGISAWDVNLEGALQSNLIITPKEQATVTVDNLEVAQFIYLLLYNKRIRAVIDTITSKVVLILGRFTPERKAVLDAMREALRAYNYSPVLFDFEKPATRDLTETVTLLARMARFVIADLTNPKSIPNELAEIIPTCPSIPVQPIIKGRARPYGMYERFRQYPWVLDLYRYSDADHLLTNFADAVIAPAEAKVQELRGVS